jgi:hypothetical protein
VAAERNYCLRVVANPVVNTLAEATVSMEVEADKQVAVGVRNILGEVPLALLSHVAEDNVSSVPDEQSD